MATIRLLQQMSGSRNGVPWPELGAEMEVGEDEAALLTSGQTPIAELVEDKAEPPAAPAPPVAEDAETAPKPTTRPASRSTAARK